MASPSLAAAIMVIHIDWRVEIASKLTRLEHLFKRKHGRAHAPGVRTLMGG